MQFGLKLVIQTTKTLLKIVFLLKIWVSTAAYKCGWQYAYSVEVCIILQMVAYLPHGGATTVIINVDSGRAVLEVRSDSV